MKGEKKIVGEEKRERNDGRQAEKILKVDRERMDVGIKIELIG